LLKVPTSSKRKKLREVAKMEAPKQVIRMPSFALPIIHLRKKTLSALNSKKP
jgi:hypothetical protein